MDVNYNKDDSVNKLHCNKCKQYLDILDANQKNRHKIERAKVFLEFLGKLMLPVTIVFIAILFKPTLTSLLNKTEEAEFLGASISFSKSTGFKGDLTPLALYYLIGSSKSGAMNRH